jgi:hypothetical protein
MAVPVRGFRFQVSGFRFQVVRSGGLNLKAEILNLEPEAEAEVET